MKTHFYKYQGAGNDFVMIDNRNGQFDKLNIELIQSICDRRFGVGADGLILIENHNEIDFDMIYFNSDGSQSFCGNGSRCAVAFANRLGIIEAKTTFMAIDGKHDAYLEGESIFLKMSNVKPIEKIGNDYFLDTGSPHYVQFVDKIKDMNVFSEGKAIRNSDRFKVQGTNVNFIEKISDTQIAIRTYERGVENETLACGTGVTAAAIVHGVLNKQKHIFINAQGGDLEVQFKGDKSFSDIWLKGPAEMVFEGEIDV